MSISRVRDTRFTLIVLLLSFSYLVSGCSRESEVGEIAFSLSTVSGPIAVGRKGRPFTSSLFDLSPFGYVEEEYFIEGMANSYKPAPGSTLRPDGHWDVVVSGTQPYKSRFIVRRPVDPEKFNGTVVVEWLQS